MLGLRPPGFEFRIMCLEGSVISRISPSSGASPGPNKPVCAQKWPKARFIYFLRLLHIGNAARQHFTAPSKQRKGSMALSKGQMAPQRAAWRGTVLEILKIYFIISQSAVFRFRDDYV